MCGITGFVNPSKFSMDDLYKMSSLINHRGPDDSNFYQYPLKNFAVKHNRLSIIDLNKTGSQPMISKLGNVLVYNGEIYNFIELKNELLKKHNINFNGTSDTEILLYLIEIYGIEKTLDKIKGMFVFCFLDKIKEKVFFARDRIGEKPLYYGFNNGIFYFTSELKSLFGNKDFKPVISKKSFNYLTTLNYIPSPFTIYNNIYKLKQGHYFYYDLNKETTQKINQTKYWFNKIKINNKNTFENCKKKLKNKLFEVVESELIADVDIGIFLSSGIDSSLIASIASKISKKKLNTFSLGFKDKYFDESSDSKKIAEYIGSNHKNIFIDNADYIKSIKKISSIYCEPFSDSSQIVTIPLCNFASNYVKVCLTGDGGDELFGGYNRYINGKKLEKYFNNNINFFEKFILEKIQSFNNQKINNFFLKIEKYIPNSLRIDNLILKLKKMKDSKFKSEDFFEFYLKNLSHDADKILENSKDFLFMKKYFEKNIDIENTMMFFDQNFYLPDDLVVKMERASMASSLEIRSPFLHHEIVEFANTIPLQYKISNKKGKLITRSILEELLPKKYLLKKKKGFLVPLESLLKGELKQWSENILFSKRVNEHNFYSIDTIKKEWIKFQNNEIINFYKFWDLIVFQNWYEEHF